LLGALSDAGAAFLTTSDLAMELAAASRASSWVNQLLARL
jgi:hypothetical protein